MESSPPAQDHPSPEDLDLFQDGELPASAQAAIETHLATCVECKKVVAELSSLRGLAASLRKPEVKAEKKSRKQNAASDIEDRVTRTLAVRSGGRFFAKKAFGDRVPFGWIAIVSLVVLVALFLWMRSSMTGSLK